MFYWTKTKMAGRLAVPCSYGAIISHWQAFVDLGKPKCNCLSLCLRDQVCLPSIWKQTCNPRPLAATCWHIADEADPQPVLVRRIG